MPSRRPWTPAPSCWCSVLPLGEPGSGKSLLARSIAAASGRGFRRIEVEVALGAEIPRAGLLYLARLDDLPPSAERPLRDLIEDALEGQFPLVLAGQDRE